MNNQPEWRSPGDRRGTDKEPGLPFARDQKRLGGERQRFKLHHHDDGHSGRSRHGGVHHDAELTVIGIGLVGVQVRNLGNGQHGQQGKAKAGGRDHETAARAEIHVQICLKSSQSYSPTA